LLVRNRASREVVTHDAWILRISFGVGYAVASKANSSEEMPQSRNDEINMVDQPVVPILAPLDDLLLDMSADHSMYFSLQEGKSAGVEGAMPVFDFFQASFGEFAEGPRLRRTGFSRRRGSGQLAEVARNRRQLEYLKSSRSGHVSEVITLPIDSAGTSTASKEELQAKGSNKI
jgi:hypothetical protein